MKLSPALIEALAARKPSIAESFVRIVTYQFNKMVEMLGPELKNVGNDHAWARIYHMTVRQFVTYEELTVVDRIAGKRPKASFDAERLAKGAAKYADLVVESWQGKIQEKLGELDNASVDYGDSNLERFVINGTRQGKAVRICQERIINVSSKGLLFHQFPARVYVDNKFFSAAAYKKLFKAA